MNTAVHPCSWWINRCPLEANHLTLIGCEQGHIKERLLCDQHNEDAITYIGETMLVCECNLNLTHYMTKTPIEDHWDLSGALNNTEAIITTFGTGPAPWATIPPYAKGGTIKGPTINPGIGGAAWGLPIKTTFPVKDPTTKEINDLQEALNKLKEAQTIQKDIKKAMEDLSKPTTNPKTLSWLKKHFKNYP